MKNRKIPKNYCRVLAETVTNQQIYDMLKRAKENVSNWEAPSRANKGISRGSNWNMFCKDFSVDGTYASILKYRMLEEFGEYLDEDLKPEPRKKREIKTTHFPPDLSNF